MHVAARPIERRSRHLFTLFHQNYMEVTLSPNSLLSLRIVYNYKTKRATQPENPKVTGGAPARG